MGLEGAAEVAFDPNQETVIHLVRGISVKARCWQRGLDRFCFQQNGPALLAQLNTLAWYCYFSVMLGAFEASVHSKLCFAKP
jgi:hypothetical protein